MIQQFSVIYSLTDEKCTEKFRDGILKALELLGKNGFKPSQIEFHYQQTDKYISVLIVGKKDV